MLKNKEYRNIRKLHNRGSSIKGISRDLGISRQAIRKAIEGIKPRYKSEKRGVKIDRLPKEINFSFTKQKIYLKEIPCTFCLSQSTYGHTKESGWFVLHCYSCRSSSLIPIPFFESWQADNKLMKLLKQKNIDEEYVKSARTSYEGPIICTCCLTPFKNPPQLTKTGNFYHFRCEECLAKGYVSIIAYEKWKLLTVIIESERV